MQQLQAYPQLPFTILKYRPRIAPTHVLLSLGLSPLEIYASVKGHLPSMLTTLCKVPRVSELRCRHGLG